MIINLVEILKFQKDMMLKIKNKAKTTNLTIAIKGITYRLLTLVIDVTLTFLILILQYLQFD